MYFPVFYPQIWVTPSSCLGSLVRLKVENLDTGNNAVDTFPNLNREFPISLDYL